MIKVSIIDDHPVVVQGIGSLLEMEKDIVWGGGARHPADLESHLRQFVPDVLLMDIHLPGMLGPELCRATKKTFPAMHIVGLSTSTQASTIQQMLASGASGFLLKDASGQEISEAIRTVMTGKTYLAHSVTLLLRRQQAAAERMPAITRRECEVLSLIADGLTNQQIADKLFLSVGTIDSHRKNMLTKFGVNNTAALVKFAITHQLI